MPVVAPTSPSQLPYDVWNWDTNGLVVYSQDLKGTLWNTIGEFDWAFADLYNYQNGILGSGLQVSTNNSGMQLQVSTGRARALNGLKVAQLISAGINGQPANFIVTPANGSAIPAGQSRIDAICLKYDFFTYTDSVGGENHTVDNTSIKVVQGTAGVSPVAPSMPDNTYVQLATLLVPTGATLISQCTIDNTQRNTFSPLPAPNSSVPTGTILEFGGTVAPAGFLLLPTNNVIINVSRTTYAALFGVIGTAFGAGDGVTTFGLPNKTGRTASGIDTTATILPNAATVGQTSGASTVTLTTAQIPSHNHTDAGHFHAINDPAHVHTQNAHTHTDSGHAHVHVAHNHTDTGHGHTQSTHTHTDAGHTHANSLSDPGHTHIEQAYINSAAASFNSVPGFDPSETGVIGTTGVPSQSSTTGASVTNASGTAALGNTTAVNLSGTAAISNTTSTENNASAALSSTTSTNNSAVTGISVNSGVAANGATGGGTSHSIVQPTIALNHIIKT